MAGDKQSPQTKPATTEASAQEETPSVKDSSQSESQEGSTATPKGGVNPSTTTESSSKPSEETAGDSAQ